MAGPVRATPAHWTPCAGSPHAQTLHCNTMTCMRQKLLQQQLASYKELCRQAFCCQTPQKPSCTKTALQEKDYRGGQVAYSRTHWASHMHVARQGQCRPHQHVGDHLQRFSHTAITQDCRLTTPSQRMLVCQQHAQKLKPALEMSACWTPYAGKL